MSQVNPFKIVITAVDKATATVNKINRSFDRLTRPVRRFNQSIKALGRATGFDRLGNALLGVIRTTRDLGESLRSIAAPMLALIGGGTIAGIWGLAKAWGLLGERISQTAATIGVSVTDLQALRGAAQAVGLSTQALDGGLKSLGESLEDALYGRNQQALVTLNRLGIGIHKTASGAIDTKRALLDLSNVIARIKSPQVQGLVARTLGVEALLPLLRQGANAIDAYQARVAELGGVKSQAAIQAAEQFGVSMNFLSIATQGVRDAIGVKLLPVLQPLIEHLTDWVGKNRELIATQVAQFVERLVRWLEQLDFDRIGHAVGRFIRKIEKVVDWLGGWKNAALLVAVAMNSSLVASVINLGLALGRLGMVMWANPILVAIGAIAVAIFLIYKNWDGLTQKIEDTLNGLGRWRSVAEALLAYFSTRWAVGMLSAIGKVGTALKGISLASKAGLAAAAGVGGWTVGNAIRPYLDDFIHRKSGGRYGQLWDIFTGVDRTQPFTQEELDRARGGKGAQLTPSAQRQLNRLESSRPAPVPMGRAQTVAFRRSETPHNPSTDAIAQAVAFFKQKGWTRNQAAGIVANLKIESGLNPQAIGDHGAAYGLAQWHPDRQAAFKRQVGKDIRASTLTEQLQFVHHELTQGMEQKAGQLLRGAQNPVQAARIVSDRYERPRDRVGESFKRGFEALRIAQMPNILNPFLPISNGQESGQQHLGTAQPIFRSIVQRPTQDGNRTEQSTPTTQKMQIELTLNGLSEGVSAHARITDGETIPVRIGYSMPSEVSV